MSYNAYIASIGSVNLLTSKVSKAEWHNWTTVFDCWGEGEGTNFLVQDLMTKKLRIVHTSGEDTTDKPGDIIYLHGDQSQRVLGSGAGWKIIAIAKHDTAGLRELAGIAGKKSLNMATFK